MPDLDLSTWTWDQVREAYPDLYEQYGPGTPGFVEPVAGTPGPLGLPPTNYDQAYGGIPQVPNPLTTAGDAISGNVANLPGIMELLRAYNPNYDTQQGIIGSELGGNIPDDVRRQIAIRSAERGVGIGSPLSPNADAALLAAMGLTSLSQVGKGMTNAGNLADQSYRFMSPMMVTPEQQQANSLLQSIFSSAPIPSAAAAAAMEALRKGIGLGQTSLFPGQNRLGGGGGGVQNLGMPASPTYPTPSTPFSANRYTNPSPVYGPNYSGGPAPFSSGAPYSPGGFSWSNNVWNPFDDGFNFGGDVPGLDFSYYSGEPGSQFGSAIQGGDYSDWFGSMGDLATQGDPNAWLYGGGAPMYDTYNMMLGTNPNASSDWGSFDPTFGFGTTPAVQDPTYDWTDSDWNEFDNWLAGTGDYADYSEPIYAGGDYGGYGDYFNWGD